MVRELKGSTLDDHESVQVHKTPNKCSASAEESTRRTLEWTYVTEMCEELAAAHVVCTHSKTSCIPCIRTVVGIRRRTRANRNDESDTSTLGSSCESSYKDSAIRFVSGPDGILYSRCPEKKRGGEKRRKEARRK